MIRSLTFALLFTIGGSILVPTMAVAQNSDRNAAIDRAARLREHERRIKQMIDTRRKEAQERERAEAQKPSAEPEPEQAPEEDNVAASSSAVLGFKFVNEQGVADYSSIVEEGETFLTEVIVFNIDRNPLDRIRLALDYDKRFIQPIKMFDSDLRPRTKGEPDFVVDQARSILRYDVELERPMRDEEAVLLRILWRATRHTPYTGMGFAFDELERDSESHTALYVGDRNILGVADDPIDGVLSGGLMISQKGTEEPGGIVLQGKGEELKLLYLGNIASGQNAGLKLIPPTRAPIVGEEFYVRVRLNNDYGVLIDAIDFCVEFDPEVLEVVDDDRFNFINRGINVNDGPYHENFPWDMHKRNEVRNDWGMINYHMALSNGATLPSATFARIKFRAKKSTTQTPIYFRQGSLAQVSHSSIRYFGYEQLNLDSDISRRLITLPVLPQPRQVAVQQTEEERMASEAKKAEDLKVKSLRIVRD